MRFKIFFVLICCVLLFSPASFGVENGNQQPELSGTAALSSNNIDNENEKTASAFLPTARFEFESVLEGTEVTHDFIIQNKGTAYLNIEKVRTG